MDALSGVFGTKNNFQARTPVNSFQATSPAAAGTLAQGNTQASGGAGPASGTIDRQNLLNDQLSAAASGTGGPSAAEGMLRKATSENVNNAAGMAASARGVNPALAMKTAVNAGTMANQDSAATGATLRAGEQLGARAQLGANLAQTGATQLGQQQTGTGLLATAGGQDLHAQGLNAQVAGQNAQLDLGTQQLQAGVQAGNASTNAGLFGGMINGAGAALAMAEGGEVSNDLPGGGPARDYLMSLHAPLHFDSGGVADDSWMASGAGYEGAETPTNLPDQSVSAGKRAGVGMQSLGTSIAQAGQQGQQAFDRFSGMRLSGTGSMFAHGGRVDAMVSPGEKVVPPGTSPSEAAQAVHSAPSVPGKASVRGNSPQNDTVHAKLQAGSIVLPRTVVNAKNPGKAAASFVASVMKRSEHKYRGGPVGTKAKTKGASGPDVQANVDAYDAIDMASGGFVKPTGAHDSATTKATAEQSGPTAGSRFTGGTARGLGREKHRGRIKSSGDKPAHRD